MAALLATLVVSGCDDWDRNANAYKSPRDARNSPFGPPIREMRRGPAVTETEISSSDYMIPASTPTPSLDANDVLANGPRMPTDHSHWLRGEIEGATVTVSVNGALLGELSGAIDRDITWNCRRGINQIAFTYHPSTAAGSGSSAARLQVLESEHDPPVPPLVTFLRGGVGGVGAVTSASDAASSVQRGDLSDGLSGQASSALVSAAAAAATTTETDLFTAR